MPSPCESRHQGGRELANASRRLAARPPPLETTPCAFMWCQIALTPSREWRIPRVNFLKNKNFLCRWLLVGWNEILSIKWFPKEIYHNFSLFTPFLLPFPLGRGRGMGAVAVIRAAVSFQLTKRTIDRFILKPDLHTRAILFKSGGFLRGRESESMARFISASAPFPLECLIHKGWQDPLWPQRQRHPPLLKSHDIYDIINKI